VGVEYRGTQVRVFIARDGSFSQKELHMKTPKLDRFSQEAWQRPIVASLVAFLFSGGMAFADVAATDNMNSNRGASVGSSSAASEGGSDFSDVSELDPDESLNEATPEEFLDEPSQSASSQSATSQSSPGYRDPNASANGRASAQSRPAPGTQINIHTDPNAPTTTEVQTGQPDDGNQVNVRVQGAQDTSSAATKEAQPSSQQEPKAGSSSTEPQASSQQEAAPVNEDPAVAAAAAETRGQAPRWWPSAIRVIPAIGAASFTTANEIDVENFDNGLSYGAFIDIGSGAWVFETGVLALQTEGSFDANTGAGAFDVDSWGIPLLLKVNFSGNPTSTVFLKVGAMPFQPDGTADEFDVLGVAGIGAAIPLFRNTALTLDATYNRLFDDTGDLGAYQGVALLGGISFGL